MGKILHFVQDDKLEQNWKHSDRHNTKTSRAVNPQHEWESPKALEIESLDCFVPRNDRKTHSDNPSKHVKGYLGTRNSRSKNGSDKGAVFY